MKRILIIDSSKTFAKFAQVVITRLGYDCMVAASARDGLQILKGRLPDLVISEIVFSDMDGLDLCRKIRLSPRTSHIPVVLASIDRAAGGRLLAQGNLCDAFLVKPVSVRDLFDALQKQLHGQTRRKNLRAPLTTIVICRDGTEHRSHITLSVGEGGLFVETERSRPVGTEVDIRIPIPAPDTVLEVRGQVIYVVGRDRPGHPPGMGIKFVDLAEESRELLSRFMESYLADILPRSDARTPVRARGKA